MSRPARRDERGAAVVVGVGVIAVLVLVAMVGVGVVGIVLAHRRAQTAADLGSLAGAAALQRGADPCMAAGMVVGRQHATVTRCVVDGTSVTLATAVDLPTSLGGGAVLARARAGPASLLPRDAGQQ